MDESNFKVYVRVKPCAVGSESMVREVDSECVTLRLPEYSMCEKEKQFRFNGVLGPGTSNEGLFGEIEHNFDYLLEGYNVSILTYGITGSGKTHTVFGVPNDAGISSKAFNYINRMFARAAIPIDIHMSFLEIYNENVRDLLSDSYKSLNLIEDATRGVYAQDLKSVKVCDLVQFEQLMHQGLQRRALAPTSNNEQSSRSHALIQIQVNSERYSPKLTIIDLAGSEKSQVDSKTNLEGANINRSLLALGNCINALSLKQQSHVPFRDSKLTRLLKDSLGGNSHTVLLACISQLPSQYDETLNTLNYATRAALIKPQLSKIYKKEKEGKEVDSKAVKHLIQLVQCPVVCARCSHVQQGSQDLADLTDADLVKKMVAARHALARDARQKKCTPSMLDRVYDDLVSNVEEHCEIHQSLKELNNIIETLSQKSQEYSSYQMVQQLKDNVDIKQKLTDALQVNANQKHILKELLFKISDEEGQKVKELEAQAKLHQEEMIKTKDVIAKQAESIASLESELQKKNQEIKQLIEVKEKEKETPKMRATTNKENQQESMDCYFKQSSDPIYVLDNSNSNKRYSNSSIQKRTNTLKLQQLHSYVIAHSPHPPQASLRTSSQNPTHLANSYENIMMNKRKLEEASPQTRRNNSKRTSNQ